MSLLVSMKKYLTVFIIGLTVVLLLTVITLARCVKSYKKQIETLKTEIKAQKNHIKFLERINENDVQIENTTRKKINVINSLPVRKLNDVLNGLYKNPLPNSSPEDSSSGNSRTTGSQIQN